MTGAEPEPEQLLWTVRLWKRDPRRLAIIAVAAIAALWIGSALVGIAAGIFGLAAVLASTAEFWMPISLRLDANGGTVRVAWYVTAMEWSKVRWVAVDETGAKLLPVAPDSRLERFRGITLRFDGNREAVMDFVKRRVGPDVRYVGLGFDSGGDDGAASEGSSGDSEAKT